MKLADGVTQTYNGEDWQDGILFPPKIDPEAAFRAAWRAWSEACEQLNYMPGHGEDIDMMKRAAQERGIE